MAEMSNKKSVLSSGNKTKKSKNDLIRAAVGHYLKQKSHVGSEKVRKSDFLLLQNKKQFVFDKMIEGDLKNGNSFIYSNVLCITNNQHIVDQQFGKFSQFVETQSDFVRSELRRFLPPMLCHLYLELLKAREPKAAVDFLKKYAHMVATVENYEAPLPTKINGCSVPEEVAISTEDGLSIHTQIKFAKFTATEEDLEKEYFIKLIQILSTCTKQDAAEHNEDVRLFRSSKYELYITEEVFNALDGYLQKRGHVLILNLIYTWLHVHIIDNEVRQWSEDYLFHGPENDDDEDDDEEELSVEVSRRSEKVSNSAVKRSPEEPADAVENEEELFQKQGRERNVRHCLKNVRESSEKLLETQTTFPRFIKVADKCRGLTSAHLDQDGCHLVAGFDSSVLQVWQMNQHTCSGKNLYQRFTDTTCKWELNNYYDIQEDDEIELAVRLDEKNCSRKRRQKLKFNAGKYEGNSVNEYGGIQLRGHNRGVTDVRFSAHYPLLYSVAKDTTMRTWRADNYSCAAVYRGHSYPIWCVDESPVGMYTATGSKDLTARLWSLDREFPLITYVGHTQDVECLAFHPNGTYVASGSADLSVRLWCVTSGKLMRVFTDCKQSVSSIAFSPDGKFLAACGEETKIRIFDLAAGSQLTELKELTTNCTSIAWSSSGQLLAAVLQDGSMRLWDVAKINSSANEGCINSKSTSSSSSSSLLSNRLMSLSSNSQRLVKVIFNRNETLSCIGN